MVDIDTMTSPVFMEPREALVFLAQIKARIDQRISELQANLEQP